MSNQFVDTESGGGTRDGTATRDYLGNDEGGGLQFTTPFDMHTVGQIWHQRTGTMTARLCRVFTSILAAGGCDDCVIECTTYYHHADEEVCSCQTRSRCQYAFD